MTREEAIEILKTSTMKDTLSDQWQEAYKMAIQALSQEPCEDAISREDAEQMFRNIRCHLKPQDYKSAEEFNTRDLMLLNAEQMIHALPSVTQKSGHCKECKYFEYDSVAKVDGIPLIVAHEICNKWGDGCKTSEDGYCYLFEPQEREDKTE